MSVRKATIEKILFVVIAITHAYTHTFPRPLTGLTPKGPWFIPIQIHSIHIHHSYPFLPLPRAETSFKLQTSHLPQHVIMYLFSRKQEVQQRYTELIRNVTGKWPNYDPSIPINVGIASPCRLLAHLTPPL